MTSRRLVGFLLCLALATAAHGAADATGPTFHKDVLPILQENCQECHRPSGGKIYRGGVPMSLTTYEEARPWARAIVRMTASKEMPPWDASGSPPHLWPEGYGSLLEVGATLTFDLHYHKEPGPGTGGWDQSSIALKFATKPVEHPIHFFPISNFEFEIPARHDYWHDIADRTVVFGSESTDEMLMGFISCVYNDEEPPRPRVPGGTAETTGGE